MTIVIGADYESGLQELKTVTESGVVTPLNVTGWTIKAEFTPRRRSDESPLLIVDNLTPAKGVVIDNAALGRFFLSLTAAQTELLRQPEVTDPLPVHQIRIGLYRTDGNRRQLIGDLIEMVSA